jgi:outer membrane usher protein
MFRTEELRGVAAGTFFGLVIAIFSGALPARTDPIDDLFASENSQLDGEETLYLTVVLNGKDIGQFIEVLFDPITERLSASGMALAEIGIETSGPSAGRVFLDTVENAVFHYETATQELIVTAENDALLPVKISGRSAQSIPEPQPGRGIVLNYSATSSLEQDRPNGGLSFGAVRARLELRAFNSFGSLSTNGSISSRDGRFRRDATAFTRSSPSLRITTTLGDFAASGLDWARPIRMAGLQIKRDFALSGAVMNRPELSWSGVATLPLNDRLY